MGTERSGSFWQSWREKHRVLRRTRGWVSGTVTPLSWRAQKQIVQHQPIGPFKVMERKRGEGCADSDSVKPQHFLSVTEQVV